MALFGLKPFRPAIARGVVNVGFVIDVRIRRVIGPFELTPTVVIVGDRVAVHARPLCETMGIVVEWKHDLLNSGTGS
jgi:hypothetical protein